MNTLTLNNVSYRYTGGTKNVLNGVTAGFESGKIYTIVGKSGSGKTTLLSLISGLDICSEGEILYKNQNLKDIDRDEYRAKNIGVIFQNYNLLINASAVENILLSMNISGIREREKKAVVAELLRKVGIDRETAERKVLQLSGGEQQRIGIARALSHNSDVIIADEPTGNLDGENETEVLSILTRLAHEEGKCVIIVTHSKKVTAIADEVWGISDGKLLFIRQSEQQ